MRLESFRYVPDATGWVNLPGTGLPVPKAEFGYYQRQRDVLHQPSDASREQAGIVSNMGTVDRIGDGK